MQKLAFLGSAVGLGLVALLAAQRGLAADRLDSRTLAPTPVADINDVYAWMDGANLNLAMSVSPADVAGRAFEPGVQYVFHVHSKRLLGVGVPGPGTETRVICTFASDTSVQCWVSDDAGVKDYVTGDPSNTDGLPSTSRKVRVFAGRRSDPLFFNLQGFRAAAKALTARLGQQPPVAFDAAGCPTSLTLTEVQTFAANLGAQVAGEPPCSTTQRDCFAELNVRMIVAQLDPSLVNSGSNTTVGVWASTHAAP